MALTREQVAQAMGAKLSEIVGVDELRDGGLVVTTSDGVQTLLVDGVPAGPYVRPPLSASPEVVPEAPAVVEEPPAAVEPEPEVPSESEPEPEQVPAPVRAPAKKGRGPR